MNSVVGRANQLGFSGSTVIATEHAREFIRKGVPVTFVTTLEGMKYLRSQKIYADCLITSRWPRRNYLLGYMWNLITSLKYLRRDDEQVYIVSDILPDSLFGILLGLQTSSKGRRIIFSCHHQIAKNDKWHPKVSYYIQRFLHRYIKRLAYKIVVPNELIDLPKKVVVYGASRLRRQLPFEEKKGALFLGNYQKVKGIDILKRLQEKIDIRVLGDTTHRITGAEKYWALGSARVVVLPSYYESFSLVAIEAMSMGTPVVAFGIPSLKSIYKKGMFFARPYDENMMYEAIDCIVNINRVAKGASDEAYEYSEEFTWEKAAEKVLSEFG